MAVSNTTDRKSVPTSTPAPDTCPVCGAATVNGQGLYTCGECGWTGTL